VKRKEKQNENLKIQNLIFIFTLLPTTIIEKHSRKANSKNTHTHNK